MTCRIFPSLQSRWYSCLINFKLNSAYQRYLETSLGHLPWDIIMDYIVIYA